MTFNVPGLICRVLFICDAIAVEDLSWPTQPSLSKLSALAVCSGLFFLPQHWTILPIPVRPKPAGGRFFAELVYGDTTSHRASVR